MASPILSNMLFLGVFGGVFQSREVGLDGTTYIQFLVPGLCIMGAIMAAYQNPSSSLMIRKYQGIVEELNTFPLTSGEKTFAFIASGAIRGLLVSGLTYASTIPFAGASIEHPLWFLLTLTVVSVIFSAFGVVVGLYGKTFDHIAFWQTIVLTPLVYFGGVFFEVTKLPGILSEIAIFNPLFPLVDAVRWAYLGTGEGNPTVDVWVMGGLFVFSSAFAWWLFYKGKGLQS